MARHPKVFEELYVNMVRAGEASGNLDAVLFRLAEFLDAQNRLRGKVVSAHVLSDRHDRASAPSSWASSWCRWCRR